MRDAMVFGATCAMLLFSMRSVFSAYLVWGWMGIIALNMFVYGFMADIQYVQIFAIITLMLFLIKRDPKQAIFESNRTSKLYIIFGFHALICAFMAEPDLARNWELCGNLLKTLLYCLMMPLLVTSRMRIHAMVVMMVLAISFHGGLDGLKFISSGGAHHANGNAKLGDNNHFALIIVLSIPMLLYLYYYSAYRYIRWGFFSLLIISILAVVATASRGGFVSLVIVGVWVTLNSKRKIYGILLMAVISFLMLQYAPESWTEKMNSINQVAVDTSFMGRVAAWKRASAIAVDHPLLGGGFHAGQAATLFPKYRYQQGLLGFVDTPDVSYPAASHSIYFEVLGDLGFVGLFLFVLIIVNAFVTCMEIKNLLRSKDESFNWIRDLSNLLMASLFVYIIGGALLSAAYLDFPYIVFMLVEVLKLQTLRECNSPDSQSTENTLKAY